MISHTDVDTLEHAMIQLSSALEDIVTIYPKLVKLDLEKVDDEVLKEKLLSRRIQLAKSVKKAYKHKKLPIIDQLRGLDSVFDIDQPQQLDIEFKDNKNKKRKRSDDSNDSDHDDDESHSDNKSPKTWPPPLPDLSPKISKQVFTHKSIADLKHYMSEKELLKEHNERLEFIGDAILNFTMTDILYRRFPDANEGQLSEMRAKLIKNKKLWEWAMQYKLDERLNIMPNTKEELLARQSHDKRSKVFADVMEAYIGGISMDSTKGFKVAQDWLRELVEPSVKELEGQYKVPPINRDAKQQLYIKIGTKEWHPQYHTIGETNKKPFTVECRMGEDVIGVGTAQNVKDAGCMAAMEALKNTDKIEHYAQIRRETPRTAPQTGHKRTKPA